MLPYLTAQLIILVPLWLSLSVHEWAHAGTAKLLGDDTAKLLGRFTLNPLAHLDPLGTVLLPLLGMPIGWAKPVPITPARFRRDIHGRTAILLVAAAGPFSNLLLAGAAFLLCGGLSLLQFSPSSGAVYFCRSMAAVNLALALFNAIPLYPLDGSRVADAVMPAKLRPLWDNIQQAGPVVLIILFLLIPMLRTGAVRSLLEAAAAAWR